MDMKVIDEILRKAKRGGRILFARTHTGNMKIKVVHGPFGVFKSRYQVNAMTYEWIKRELA